ncbi:MAG: hypothetical protein HOQ10_09495 [Frateuria sp.]|nr:hypothetical protein [Frateuria sp.]
MRRGNLIADFLIGATYAAIVVFVSLALLHLSGCANRGWRDSNEQAGRDL